MSRVQTLLPLLITLAMLWPSWGQRDCCCRTPIAVTGVVSPDVEQTSLPPCCAARLRAKQQAAESQARGLEWRSHCGCQPVWQVAEYTPVVRFQYSVALDLSSPAPLSGCDVGDAAQTNCEWIDAHRLDQGGLATCIRLSRWLA